MPQNPEVSPIRRVVAALVVFGAGGVAITGCGAESFGRASATSTTTTEAANHTTTTQEQTPQDPNDPNVIAAGSLEEATLVTDADLQRDDITDYNCGGKLRPADQPADKYSGDYWVKYANDNPELAPKQMDFYDKMLGKDAVESLLTNGYDNGKTSADAKIALSDRGNTLAHKMNVAELKNTRVYANYTCVDATTGKVDIHRAGKKPTIKVEAGGHVEGVVVDEAGIMDFMGKVKKFADGSPVAEVVNIGKVTLADGTEKQMFLVTMKAFGCDNPLSRLHVVSAPPKLPPMTVTIPRRPTTTTPGRRPKRDPNTTPGGVPGQNGGDSTSPGTKPGVGPVGQPTDPDGFVPGEYHPTPPPEKSTPTDGNSPTGPVNNGGTPNGAPEGPVSGINPTNGNKGTTNPGSV